MQPRAIAREIIGLVTLMPSTQVRLHHSPPFTAPGIGFYSLSRTNEVAAVAFNLSGGPIGVDVEEIQDPHQADQLVKVLHPKDQRRLNSKWMPRRTQRVTQAWPHKEALLKAQGIGLQRDPGLDEIGKLHSPLPCGYPR